MKTVYEIHRIFLVRDAIKTIENYLLVDGYRQAGIDEATQFEYIDALNRLDSSLSDAAI